MTAATLIGGAVGGAVMGSAAGAALDRWPVGETLIHPKRSRCATCSAALRGRDLVPVVSWLMLRGRCRSCGSRIDARLPAIELAAAVGVALTLQVHGITWLSVLLSFGVVGVLLATLTDLEAMIVPDRLTLPLGAIAVAGVGMASADRATLGTLAVWALGVPAALHSISRLSERMTGARPLGGGDVKLLVGVLALAAAIDHGPAAVLLLAVMGAGSVALLGIATGRLTRRDRIPFAPAIAAGYLTVVLAPATAPAALMLLGGIS